MKSLFNITAFALLLFLAGCGQPWGGVIKGDSLRTDSVRRDSLYADSLEKAGVKK